jgi:hypothetical protein
MVTNTFPPPGIPMAKMGHLPPTFVPDYVQPEETFTYDAVTDELEAPIMECSHILYATGSIGMVSSNTQSANVVYVNPITLEYVKPKSTIMSPALEEALSEMKDISQQVHIDPYGAISGAEPKKKEKWWKKFKLKWKR